MENLEPIIPKEEIKEKKINLADFAVKESIERIQKNLEEKQKESKDEFFKKLKIKELTPEALMILNTSMEEFEEPFPKSAKQEALRAALESPLYPTAFSSSEDRLKYIKELIILYPNSFYKKEFEK
jgi:ATP-dependent Lon protease